MNEILFEELEMQEETMSDSDMWLILSAAAVAIQIVVVFT